MAGRKPMESNSRMFLAMLRGAVFRRRSRAVMAIVSSVVGAATLFCLAAVCLAVPQQMTREMRSYGANLIVTPDSTWESKGGIDKAMVDHTTSMVRARAEATYATYRYENVRVNAASYVIAGISVTAVRTLNGHWSVDGAWPSSGSVMVGRDVADAMELKVGGTVTIAYRSQGSDDILDTKGTEFRVAGIVDTGGSEDGMIYAVHSDVDALAKSSRGVDVIEYSTQASDEGLEQTVEAINDMTSMHVSARTVTRITAADTRIITMLRTLFWIVSVVVLVLTFVGVSTTISSIVSQRGNEIGLRKAMGASNAGIASEFLVESGLYGLLGGVLGTALGYVFAAALTTVVFDRSLDMSWPLAAGSVSVSVVMAILASVPPLRRSSRIDPAVVLREE